MSDPAESRYPSIDVRGRIEILREIAKGGMGAIYEAIFHGADGFDKTIALKVILDDVSHDPEFVGQFVGEAKLVADLVHENIVQIYHLGKLDDGRYYISMEFIEGVTLEDFVNRHADLQRPLPVDLCCFIVSRVARGLEYAHEKCDKAGHHLRVVHRDVSPGNVMLTYGGVVKLCDFGIAKARNLMIHREGEILLGKARYMSPEQAAYEETDARSDVFSLGIVLHELLSGQPLFEGEDTLVTLDYVREQTIPALRTINPHLPPELCTIVERALERDREERYKTAGKMGYDLEYYMYHDRFGPTNLTLHRYLKTLHPEIKLSIDPTVPDPYFDRLIAASSD